MAEKIPVDTSKIGQLVIIPEPWIITLLEINSDIIPNKCRKVLLDVLQKGYIEDKDKFSAAFNILLIIISGEGNIEKMTPEDYCAIKEGKNLQDQKIKAAREQQEFEDYMRNWNHEAFEAAIRRTREATPNNQIYAIYENDIPEIPQPVYEIDTIVTASENSDDHYYSAEQMASDADGVGKMDSEITQQVIAQDGIQQVHSDNTVINSDNTGINSVSVVSVSSVAGATGTHPADSGTLVAVTSQVQQGGARPKERSSAQVTSDSELVDNSVQGVQGFNNIVLVADCAVISPEFTTKQENQVNDLLEYTENIQLQANNEDINSEWQSSDDEEQATAGDQLGTPEVVTPEIDTPEIGALSLTAIGDGKKPIKQLRQEAEIKKKLLQASGKVKVTSNKKKSKPRKLHSPNPSAGFAEGSSLGSRRVFIITDNSDKSERNKITLESEGRYYFKCMEGSRHTILNAGVVWNDLPQGKLSELPWDRELVRRWVAYKPHITVVSLGRQDLITNTQVRDAYTFALSAKGALKQLVAEGEKRTRQPMEIEEYRFRMRNYHCFILVSPNNLVSAVEGLDTWQYDEIQRVVRQGLIARRQDFFKQNVFVTTPGRDLMFNIREAVSKILCINCGGNYRSFNLYVRHFETGGCDDLQGATALRESLLSEGEREI